MAPMFLEIQALPGRPGQMLERPPPSRLRAHDSGPSVGPSAQTRRSWPPACTQIRLPTRKTGTTPNGRTPGPTCARHAAKPTGLHNCTPKAPAASAHGPCAAPALSGPRRGAARELEVLGGGDVQAELGLAIWWAAAGLLGKQSERAYTPPPPALPLPWKGPKHE